MLISFLIILTLLNINNIQENKPMLIPKNS
jgi:hypothetical protein